MPNPMASLDPFERVIEGLTLGNIERIVVIGLGGVLILAGAWVAWHRGILSYLVGAGVAFAGAFIAWWELEGGVA